MKLFHPTVFIADELQARGWTWRELAERMGGNADVNELALDIYREVGPDNEDITIGEMAEQLAVAFGCSPEFYRNLHNAWRASIGKRGAQ